MPKKIIPPTPAEHTSATSRLVEGRQPDPAVLGGDIDSRMKALLKDHQEMGARPKREPATEEPTTYPLPSTPKPAAAKKSKKSKK